jgi:putative hydrolase of the HAD superfamily
MTPSFPIKALFLDIGGVLLTNGWDRKARALAARQFGLDPDDLNERHHLTFDTYESGKLTLDEYLDRIVFYEARPFSRCVFRAFMMAQSEPYPGMIRLVQELKRQYGLKVVAVNNEGRELNDFRIQQFGLNTFFDAFISSCYVHFRKPDAGIFRLALDVAQVPAGQVVYIDDRKMFVEVARSLGMHCLHHTHEAATRTRLGELGLCAAPVPLEA